MMRLGVLEAENTWVQTPGKSRKCDVLGKLRWGKEERMETLVRRISSSETAPT